MKVTHHFFREVGPSAIELPEGFTCAHVTSVSGTITAYATEEPSEQYFIAEGETLPFWKIHMPYRAVTIETPALAESKGWYITA